MTSPRLQQQAGTESDDESDEVYDEESSEDNSSQLKRSTTPGSNYNTSPSGLGVGRGGPRGGRGGRGRLARGGRGLRRAQPQQKNQQGGPPQSLQQPQQGGRQPTVRGPGFFQPQGVQGPGGRFRGEGIGGWSGKMPTSLQELFSMIPLETIMIENWVLKRLVLVGDMQPLDKALQRLNRHKITALPIISETTGKIKGILDSLDIVYYLSTVLDQEGIGPARWDFNLENTGQLLAYAKRKTLVISNKASMADGIKEFSKGVPRLMVIDSDCELHEQSEEEEGILGLFTQSDVIRFLGANPYWLNRFPKSQMSLRDLGLIENPFEQVVTVDQNVVASAAFRKIAESNTRGVAVVDSQGRIVANLSATNIRGISRRNFQLLRRPLYEFLQRDRRRGWWTMPVCVKETDTFEKVVLQFASTRLHQMYAVDSDGKPYSVITQTDLMRQLIGETGGEGEGEGEGGGGGGREAVAAGRKGETGEGEGSSGSRSEAGSGGQRPPVAPEVKAEPQR